MLSSRLTSLLFGNLGSSPSANGLIAICDCMCLFLVQNIVNVNKEKPSRFSDTCAIGEFHELLCGPIRKAHIHLSFILFAKHLCFFAKQERKQLEELTVGLYVLCSWINVQQVFAVT